MKRQLPRPTHSQGRVRLRGRRRGSRDPLARARRAFAGLQFNPAILRDVSTVDTSWNVLGKPVKLPFGIAPTGFTLMMHTEGERAGAAAAAAAGAAAVELAEDAARPAVCRSW